MRLRTTDFKMLTLAGFLMTASTLVQAVPPPLFGSNTLNQTSPMATNVAPMESWTPGWVLVDAFAKARDWSPILCDFSGEMPEH